LASTARHITERTIREAFDSANGIHDPITEMHPRNRLNDMTGPRGLWFTKSVLRTSYPSILGHELRKAQGGNKPPQLMCELIEFFHQRRRNVFGSLRRRGGTALGAYLAGRTSLSIELNPESIALYHAVCQQEGIAPHSFIQGDCRDILPTLEADHFDFIATDPPYSPELQQTMSGSGASDLYGGRTAAAATSRTVTIRAISAKAGRSRFFSPHSMK